MTTELTKDQQADLTFIKRAGHWPNWPHLPMKRHTDKGLEAGTLIDVQPIGIPLNTKHVSMRTVYMTSVWAVLRKETTFKTCEKKTYNSIEEMLLDGWQVD